MIQEVVAGRDGIEHLAHGFGRMGFVPGSQRLGARHRHCARGSLACESM